MPCRQSRLELVDQVVEKIGFKNEWITNIKAFVIINDRIKLIAMMT